MTTANLLHGPAFGGHLAGSDIEHALERKEVFVLGRLDGAYLWDEDKWLWQPNDATPSTADFE